MALTQFLSDLRLALGELTHKPLRTFLTLLGMIFGVGAVIAMLAVSEGGRRESMKMIEGMGLRNIIVEDDPKEDLEELRKVSAGLSLADAKTIEETMPFVENWAGIRELEVWSVFSREPNSNPTQQPEVWAVSPSFFELSSLAVDEGRLFTEDDNESFLPIAVLGETAARELFPNGRAIGQFIKVNYQWFEVIGILIDRQVASDEFQGENVGGESDRVYIPLFTGLNRLKQEEFASELSSLKLRIAETEKEMGPASNAIQQQLIRRHGGQEDVRMVIPTDLLAQQRATQHIFTIVMSAVAGISLIVGGIGIMNIMLANVMERKSEIGLLRAVGATRADVVRQFIVETTVIALAGASLGIIAGIGIAYGIAFFANWTVAWDAFIILASVSICVTIAVGFGVYPAMSASRLDPVAALQSE
ncbi:MAG: FtsX-like permease family protein [Gammaproteobacteria bacterium]|nr:FtsX-like permease family protein [Gammaproteobacteria bacterium]MYF52485.1 FtsX-like permease family protein [Gammaproteobacteria bacterium]MYK44580.1 FtsX-like permease family protein [Gammaproteobacteria bacterium]